MDVSHALARGERYSSVMQNTCSHEAGHRETGIFFILPRKPSREKKALSPGLIRDAGVTWLSTVCFKDKILLRVLHKNDRFRVPMGLLMYSGRAEWFPAEQEGISSSGKRDFDLILHHRSRCKPDHLLPTGHPAPGHGTRCTEDSTAEMIPTLPHAAMNPWHHINRTAGKGTG
jgi:hypothetical protein